MGFYQFIKKIKLTADRKIMLPPRFHYFIHSFNRFFIKMMFTNFETQTLLDIFYLYCDTWKMKVNVDKTKIVVFSKGRLPRNLIFNYNGTNIEIVKDFNYLGIYFS
jgi:hypothetical protein